MNFASVKTRFLVSILANFVKSAVSFGTGLLIARSLMPSGYGDLTYLLGTFVAIRVLMDMGSSNAFYTLISQKTRGSKFYLIYFVWLLLQFTVSLMMVAVLMPQSLIDRIWFGNSRQLIILALLAAFMQQQVWTTIIQLGESSRQTVRVQVLGLLVIASHATVIVILFLAQWLSVTAVLVAIIIEHLLAALISTKLLYGGLDIKKDVPDQNVKQILNEYWQFCRPLMLLAVVSFTYEFVDRWMLQRYAGSIEQGFYQISAQLAGISLLATSSILSIFWKEISEANALQNKARVAYLHKRVSRGLFFISATISCLMIPWAEELVTQLLGTAYTESWPIFAILLMYPIHQSLGQVNGAMFLACSHTKTFTAIAIFGQVASIPATYLLLAPDAGSFVPGLAFGALGLAIKMVGMGILLVNIQACLIARLNGWRYDWKYQIIGIGTLLMIAYSAKILVSQLFPTELLFTEKIYFILAFLLSGLIYLTGVMVFIWKCPQMACIDKGELEMLVRKFIQLVKNIKKC